MDSKPYLKTGGYLQPCIENNRSVVDSGLSHDLVFSAETHEFSASKPLKSHSPQISVIDLRITRVQVDPIQLTLTDGSR